MIMIAPAEQDFSAENAAALCLHLRLNDDTEAGKTVVYAAVKRKPDIDLTSMALREVGGKLYIRKRRMLFCDLGDDQSIIDQILSIGAVLRVAENAERARI